MAFALAGGLVLAACTSGGDAATGDAPRPDAPDASEDPAPTRDEPDDPADGDPDPPTAEQAATAVYESFLTALATAMEDADPELPELTDRATGEGLVSAQAMVVSLTEADRVARGAFEPSIESVEVDGDVATVVDCYRADLVEFDRESDEQVADRGGARFRAEVRLDRRGDAADGDGEGGREWIVSDFSEGEPCAPAEIAETVSDRYLAFWDAVWDAADPPAPDHQGLAETAAGEHLEGLRRQLTQLQEAGQVRRGRGTEHPVVVHVTAEDTLALVRDCVEENPDTGVYDAISGERIEGGTEPGQRTLLESELELIDGTWRVVSVDVREEDSSCEPGRP